MVAPFGVTTSYDTQEAPGSAPPGSSTIGFSAVRVVKLTGVT